MTTPGEKMSTDASKFVIFKDCLKAVLDVIEVIIREISIKFISLWIELVNYRQQKEFDLQRFLALMAILYIICFIDFDFIPVFGKIDDLVVMYYAFNYCCNKRQAILAKAIYKEYELWCKIGVVIWILY